MGTSLLIPPLKYRQIARKLDLELEENDIPEITVNDLFYRAVPGAFLRSLLDNGPSFQNEKARFNIPRSFSALYFSDSQKTVLEEIKPIDSTGGRAVTPLVITAFQIKTQNIRDLTSQKAVEKLGFTLKDLRQSFTNDAEHLLPRSLALYCKKRLQASGILVQSAVCKGKNLVLFPDSLFLQSVISIKAISRASLIEN